MEGELRAIVRQKIAGYALPDVIQVIYYYFQYLKRKYFLKLLPYYLIVLHWSTKDPIWQDHAAHSAQGGR